MKFAPVTLSAPGNSLQVRNWSRVMAIGHQLDAMIANPIGLDVHQQLNNIYIGFAVTRIITGSLDKVSSRWRLLEKSIMRVNAGEINVIDLDLDYF